MFGDSFEEIIGRAILGNGEDGDLAEAQVAAKTAACTQMLCHCGNVLDQKTVVVIEYRESDSENWETLGGYCPECWASAREKVSGLVAVNRSAGLKFRVRTATWGGFKEIEPEEEASE